MIVLMQARLKIWLQDHLDLIKEASKLSRDQLVVLAILALAMAAGGMYAAKQSRTVPVVVQEATPDAPKTQAGKRSDRAARKPKASVYVHVAGDVVNPGLYKIEDGSRVADAVEAAGGALDKSELDNVNLAEKVRDGQKVYLGSKGAFVSAGSPEIAGDGPEAALINLNSATEAELESLDGIGPVLAGRIIAWRESHDGFSSIGQLGQVSGIGSKKYQGLKAHVTIY